MDHQHLEKIRKWIDLDNKVVQLKSHLAELTDEKKELENDILEYIKSNSLEKVKVNVADGTLKFAKRSSQQAMSIKYLKTTLMKYNEEEEPINTEAVLQYLLTNLQTKTTMFIKRDISQA
jgi:hypothetical protein